MFQSMTGFGSALQVFKSRRGTLEIGVDIKTVNSKFLDVSVRSPRSYSVFDSEITKAVREKLKRGRVDVTISVRVLDGATRDVSVNMAQVTKLKNSYDAVCKKLKLSHEVTLSDLLKLPDWIETRDLGLRESEEWKYLRTVLDQTIEKVIETRAKEGKSLHRSVTQHRNDFEKVFKSIAVKHDVLMDNLKGRTRERIQGLLGDAKVDANRMEQELVYWLTRSDFREEVDRITHHLQTLDEILKGSGEAGRKMEFLVQEMQREINTLGSKCPDAAVTPHVIELKTYVERIREQLQNIE